MSRKKKILFVNEFSQLATGFSTYGNEVMKRLNATGKYELAEQASYCSPEDPRIFDVDWQVFPTMPNRDDQAGWQRYHANKTAQFGELSFTNTLLTFKPDMVCVPPGELVFTNRGYIPIEKVTTNDYVLTHKNRMRKVVKTMRRYYKGKTHKVWINGISDPLVLTSDHPVFGFKKKKQTNQQKSYKKIYKNLKPEFIPIQNIKKGDVLCLPSLDQESVNYLKIDLTDYLSNVIINDDDTIRLHKNGNNTNRYVEVNEDFSRLCGYLIGDGHISDGGINLSFGKHETIFIDDSVKIIKKLFNIDAFVRPCSDKEMTLVICNNTVLSKFFEIYIGYRTKTKFIPWHVFISKKTVKENMICGLVRSDGCYSKNTVNFTTVNKRLAYEYRLLCVSIDIPVNLRFCSERGPNGAYIVNGYGESADDLHLICNKYSYSKINRPKNIVRSARHTQIIDERMISSVKRSRIYDYEGFVYNLEVEEDNSYVLQTCVHNCNITDVWMQSFIHKHPYRPYYKYIWMATIDGEPQRPDWLDEYRRTDYLLTYSEWAANIVSKEGIKVHGVHQPGTDTDVFKPPENKRSIKQEMGLNSDWNIVQTVMRNQPRKLYPELFRAFSRFLEICKESGKNDLAAKTFLHVHCSLKDVGWDIAEEIRKYKLGHKVLLTYVDQPTQGVYFSFYKGEPAWSRLSNGKNAFTTNTGKGVSREQLAKLMQCSDLYIQYSICEGFGMCDIDAKACGTPIMGLPYSATAEKVIEPGGIPLKIAAFRQESHMETSQRRAEPDNEYTARKIFDFFNAKQEYREKLGKEAREIAVSKYSWDGCAKKWENLLDSIEVPEQNQTWNSQPFVFNPDLTQAPKGLNNEQFIAWCFNNIVGRPWMLRYDTLMGYMDRFNYGDGGKPFTRNDLVKECVDACNSINNAEILRYNTVNSVEQQTRLVVI